MEPNNEKLANPSDPSFQEQLTLQQEALAKIYISVEKTRKYIFWSSVFNIVVFVLPLVIVAVMLPMIINTVSGSLGALNSDTENPQTTGSDIPSLSKSLENLKNLGL